MIAKILKLQNVGLLHDACANGAVRLERVTAIYAENGRGKSTLAATLRACGLASAARIAARRTLDDSGVSIVDILLADGSHAKFDGQAWTGSRLKLEVFDSEFVEHNVYSGFEVRPDQRQALLQFALGDATVGLMKRLDQLSQDIKRETTRRTTSERILDALAPPYPTKDFIALQPIADAETKITAIRKRIEASKSAQRLAKRTAPTTLQTFQFDVGAAFGLLGKTLKDVEQAAESTVQAHFAKHQHPGIEAWISNGQTYATSDDCPFCGQPLEGVNLIKAYQSYFNAEYERLKADLGTLDSRIGAALADSKIEAIAAIHATNCARIDAWAGELQAQAPALDVEALRSSLSSAREIVAALLKSKQQQPLSAFGDAQADRDAVAALSTANAHIENYNRAIQQFMSSKDEFLAKLAQEDVSALDAQIKQLQANQRRQSSEAPTAASEVASAAAERRKLEQDKTAVREQIDNLMQDTLAKYQGRINSLLKDFGAEFTIDQLKPSYVGSTGTPRTEFVLQVRHTPIRLGTRADLTGGCGFATTLSDADKRTLAFAFFVARLETDPKLAEAIVVLDDPMSSFDRNRRRATLQVIEGLTTRCKQLILLSHDCHFVRSLRDQLAKHRAPATPFAVWSLSRTQGSYSVFAACDIDDICSSSYYRHHRTVAGFVDGRAGIDGREVAKAIRPLLEGYYHRRFPGLIPRGLMFGEIIAKVAAPGANGPLANLQPVVRELQSINDFVKGFMHDGGELDASAVPSDTELRTYAERALNLIYANG